MEKSFRFSVVKHFQDTSYKMSERTTEGVPALNVYQVAADIGKDFEGLIEKFGSDGFRDIMPKIIKSLEHLEESVKNAETLRENVCNLEEQLHRLEEESEQKEKENIQLIQVSVKTDVIVIICCLINECTVAKKDFSWDPKQAIK